MCQYCNHSDSYYCTDEDYFDDWYAKEYRAELASVRAETKYKDEREE